eukprot:g13053.t1
MGEADAKAVEIDQVKWLTRSQVLTAFCYILTYSIGFRFSVAYITTSSISPDALKSKDPKIGDKFVVFAEFTTAIILAQRIVNLLTGTVFGEIGQAWGRKKLVIIALTGYAVGSLTMLIGYLTSQPNTWEACYQPCFAASTNETTAESVCVAKCVKEDAEAGSHFNGQAFYYISQGIIGMCAPFAVAASSFIVDVSVDFDSFVKNYAHMRAFGYAGGLGFGYLFGLILLGVLMKNIPAFFVTLFVCGIICGTLGTMMAAVKLKEPLTEEKKKKCCANPMDFMFWSSLSFPLQKGSYTFFLFLANGFYAYFFAYWESTTTHYFFWNYSVDVTYVMIGVIVVFIVQLTAIRCIIPRLGFRRSIYYGFIFFVCGILVLSLTRKGPNDVGGARPTGYMVLFLGGLLYAGNGCLQSSMLALYNSQGGPKDTGPLGGAWKTGEATFKLVGSLCASVYYPVHVRRCNADPTILPGLHYIIFATPAAFFIMFFFMIADQKYGHLAKDQEYQKDTIFMGWGATAKVEDNFVTVSKPAQKPEAEN